jgi:alkylhydroperoxidase family enzyme
MFLSKPPLGDTVKALYEKATVEDGYVMNYIRLWSWRADVHAAFSEARGLLSATSSLSKREIAILNATTASRAGDSSCSIAWGGKLADVSDVATAAALLQGRETPAFADRERALISWAAKVVEDPNGTTREDIEALKASGFSEREIFEATLFVAFRLAFMTVNDALGAQPDRRLAASASPAILASVTFGRAVDDAPGESMP